MKTQDIEHLASEYSQQDWNRLEYAKIYREGFIKGATEVNAEVEQLQKRNAELESMLVEVNNNRTGVSPCARFCEALAAKKMFDNLQRERNELAAQVEQLIKAFDEFHGIAASCDGWEAFPQKALDNACDAMMATPAQCLAEIKAQAVEPIFNKLKSAHGETTHPRAKVYLCEEAFELAAEVMQLRQQAEAGEL